MPVALAYLTVVMIWSTTPLGIVWSSESVNPIMAIMLRTAIAAPLALLLVKLMRYDMPWHTDALKLYGYSALNGYLGMILTYIAARDLSSGLISLIYGLAPMVSGLLAQKIIQEPPFSRPKLLALVIAFGGLLVVCLDRLSLQADHLPSLVFVLLGMICFSLSAVMVKSVKLTLNPLVTTAGSLAVSLPLFMISWFLLDGSLETQQWQLRSVVAIMYLGTFGSILGFVAYYYVLQKLTAASVGLITLITPVMALILGATLNNEVISTSIITGALAIIAGLALYQFGDRLIFMLKERGA